MQDRHESPDDQDTRRPQDTVLGNLIGYRLKRAYMQIQPQAQRVLAEDDLRVVSFSCLSVIADNPGIVPSELADALRMERSNLVVVIDELEQRGLMTRTRMATDRRRYALTVTLRGRHLRDRAARKVQRAEDEILGRLNDEDRARLMAALERLEANETR